MEKEITIILKEGEVKFLQDVLDRVPVSGRGPMEELLRLMAKLELAMNPVQMPLPLKEQEDEV